jgi:flagellar biosynthesis chaperone FliJ
MEIIPIRLPLSGYIKEKEDRLMLIEELIEAKRNMLIQKQKKIKHVVKQNKFLDSVKNDYIKYFYFIVQQKQDQIKALDMLNKYIYDLSNTGELSKNNLEDAKVEQEKILREVKSIKRGLDSIINNTNYINTQLKEKHISL